MSDRSEVARQLILRWAPAETRRAIGRWMGERIEQDSAYISHGEIQTGLSRDGARWIDNLAERLANDIDVDPEREVVEAVDGQTRLGAAVVFFAREGPARYIVIEDLVVDPAARSAGVGAALVAFIEREAAAQGADWSFLESGLRNERAHEFFARGGYAPLSKVFGKRLS